MYRHAGCVTQRNAARVRSVQVRSASGCEVGWPARTGGAVRESRFGTLATMRALPVDMSVAVKGSDTICPFSGGRAPAASQCGRASARALPQRSE